jgi:undecaprenyl-diphosphatase
MDQSAVIRLTGRRTDGWSAVMRTASRLGNGQLWAVLGIAVAALASDGLMLLARLAIAFSLELSGYVLLKKSTSRPRPFVTLPEVVRLVVPPDEFSFPSGHTAAAFLMLTALAGVSALFIVPLGLLAVLIGMSRVYLGVHYPSDVAAGALLGTMSALGAWAIL